jgi:DNA-binding LacI/PurR family transcriptional regulator
MSSPAPGDRLMGVTQQQIADKLGLSQRAVSMALRGDERLSPETIERVWAMAQKLGYRPNTAARSIRSGRFNNVTVVLSSIEERSRFTIPFLNHLLACLDGHGMHLSIARIPDEKLVRPASLPRLLSELASDGLIINYLEHVPPALAELVEQSSQPAVWVGAKLHHDCVYPDALAAGRMATEHLLNLGHERIIYFDPISEDSLAKAHYSSVDRREGYTAAMQASGLTPEHWEMLSPWRNDLESALAMFERSEQPTAVICAWQSHLAALAHAAGLRGLRIPQDLSVVVISDPNVEGPVRMTRVAFDFKHRAEETVRMLMDQIDGTATGPADAVAIQPQLLVRDSTTRPAGNDRSQQ